MRGSVFDELGQRFDEMRRDLLGEPMGGMGLAAGQGLRAPACDLLEEDNQYVVAVDLPGFEKKDVRLEVEESGVHIRASKERREETPPNGRYLRQERAVHAYERFIPLPDEVSPDGVRATFRNGVLEVVIPKTAPEKRRRRSIEIA